MDELVCGTREDVCVILLGDTLFSKVMRVLLDIEGIDSAIVSLSQANDESIMAKWLTWRPDSQAHVLSPLCKDVLVWRDAGKFVWHTVPLYNTAVDEWVNRDSLSGAVALLNGSISLKRLMVEQHVHAENSAYIHDLISARAGGAASVVYDW